MIKENELKNVLKQYQDMQIQKIEPEKMQGYNHVFSHKFEKKIKSLFRSEKYFGKHIYIGYIVRKIAVFVLVLISILAALEVGAKVFGFQPWLFNTTSYEQNEMEQRIYEEPVETDRKMSYVKNKLPLYIPTGYRNTDIKISNKEYSCIFWQGKGKSEIQYVRTLIIQGMVIAYDASYKQKENLLVNGFQGKCYYNGEECWIIWDDCEYSHCIISVSLSNAKREMVKMANSIYDKK